MTRFGSKAFLATGLIFLLCSLALPQTPTNTTVYIYDELGRLKAVITPSGDSAVYTYDAAGNILSITRQSSAQVSIIEFTPDQGATSTSVTIYGTGFSVTPAQNSVQFNGVAATVSAASATQLIAVVPAGATTGPITVTTPTGSAVSTMDFEVLQSLSITSFTPTIGTPGTAVQISGTDFDPVGANNQLKFNITTAGVTSATSTTIDTTVPTGATSGHISITTQAATATSSADFFVPPSPFTAASVDFAGRISMDETKTLSVNAANHVALLVFDGTTGQRISLQAANSTISSSTVRIIKPDGSNLLNPTSRSGNWFIDTLTLPVTGTYTILIDPNSTFTGSMNLTLHNVPPDVTGTITAGGPPLTVTMTTPGQNANVSFAGTAGQRISLNVNNVSISSSSVTIQRANGTTLASSPSVTTAGVFFDTMVLPATENYSILINPSGAATGGMTLNLSDVPADATSTIVIGGSHVVVTIATPGQNAQLTFTGTAGQIVELDWQGTLSYFSSPVINQPDGTPLYDDYGFSWNDDIYLLPATGTYTIYISPADASTGSTTFALYEIPQPVTGTIEPNGQPITVTIPTTGQIAKVTFNGTAGQQMSLKINNIKTGPYGSYVEVRGPDGSYPGYDYPDPEYFYDDDLFDYYSFIDTMTLPATGTYTITIFPDASSGSMDLTLYTVPPDVTATITPGGPPVTVTTAVPGQDGRLTFSGTAGQRISLKVNSVFPFYPYVCVLNPDGYTFGNCLYVTRDRTFIDTLVLPTTGTYTIRVNGLFSAAGTATVNLYDVPPVITGTLALGGPPVTVTATAPGQDAEMTFTGTAGQRMSLKVSGTLPEFSNISVLRPNGQSLLLTNRFIRQIGTVRAELIETLVLPTTGTYKVKVNTWNGAGTITFNLYEVPADVNDGVITSGGPPVTVTSTAERQNRRLTFEGTAGQMVNLKINNDTSWLNHLWIYRPDGVLLAGRFADAASKKVIDTDVLPLTGTYSILTELFADGDAVTLTLSPGASDVTGTLVLDGQPATITVPASGQIARYSFNGTAGQRVGIKISDVTMREGTVSTGGLEMECCSQTFVSSEGTGRERFSLSQITATGPNALVVDPYFDYIGSLTVRPYDVPPDVTGTVTLNGPAVTVTTTTPGQNATLTFDGTTGQQVTIHVANNTVGKITVEVFRPTGFYQAYQLASGSSFDLPLQTLPTPGAYSILINPWRANTGSVVVSVTSP